jgi:hypothetical protein
MSWHDSPRFKPIRSFASVSSSIVEPRGKTWGIRSRGDQTGTVKHSYRCPVHGQFDAQVSRTEVPDEMPCSAEDRCLCLEQGENRGQTCPVHDLGRCPNRCGLTSPWAGSQCGIGHAAGEVMS